jgi:hypothetical protein
LIGDAIVSTKHPVYEMITQEKLDLEVDRTITEMKLDKV